LIAFGDHHLLVACYDANAIVELDAAGREVRVIDRDSAGKPFTGPNDFAADGTGGVYVSASGVFDLAAPITGTILHLTQGGARCTELAASIHYPNGLTVSRDKKDLLVAEMLAGRILAFPILPDGGLGPRRVWARLQDIAAPTPHADAYNGPDGLKLGPDGNYYVAQNGSGRVLVVDEGKHLVRSIDVDAPYVTNMNFGPRCSIPGSRRMRVWYTVGFDDAAEAAPMTEPPETRRTAAALRPLGHGAVSPIGLGCMNLSHAYAAPPPVEAATALLERALQLGITHFDTAALYGFGANEELLGRVLAPHRYRLSLASKGGMYGETIAGRRQRVIDGRPATLRRNCEDSLRRLRTEVLDLYYLHRWDKRVPIESVGALGELKREGKIRAIGLCEVSAETLLKAHAQHPIAAVQSEYSLCTRNPEIAVLETCRRIGAAFVAFSPLGRGFLTGTLGERPELLPQDIRRGMPRFEPANFSANLALLEPLRLLAAEAGCTMGQLALAWVSSRGDHVLAIPGTTQVAHLEENTGADRVVLDAAVQRRLDALFSPTALAGDRYNSAAQAEIDSESFGAAGA
jgi:aryl-alcohol dehydrogenase-like predicted oxidoreductase